MFKGLFYSYVARLAIVLRFILLSITFAQFSAAIPSLAVLSFIPSLVIASWQVGNAVQLDSGLVICGHGSTWQPGVSEYLGIPYARPPVGALRWKPAEPDIAAPGTPFVADQFVSDLDWKITRITANRPKSP